MLRAAAESIDEASVAELEFRFMLLMEARASRTRIEVIRQQDELRSGQLDQAAYDFACQAEGDGDLPAAVCNFRLAAMNDFADASLRLATLLDSMAEKYLSRPAGERAEREEIDLETDAALWYLKAYAAGDIGTDDAGGRLDWLVARHPRNQADRIPQPGSPASPPVGTPPRAGRQDAQPAAEPGHVRRSQPVPGPRCLPT